MLPCTSQRCASALEQTSLACMFCFTNTGHVIILWRTVSFKFRIIRVQMYALFMKRKRNNFPWDLCWGKLNIEAKKVYSSTSRGVGATSSPGRFSLALDVWREKRPGDEVGVGGACES